MARIVGVEIPNEKKLKISLTYIHGIGHAKAQDILKATKLDGEVRTKKLTEDELSVLRKYLEEDMEIEGALKQKTFRNIKRLKDVRCYKGIRHKLGLPVKGQRTRCNARTRKGKGLAVGGLKQKITKT
jgi:small subunit ribosomal protein S13